MRVTPRSSRDAFGPGTDEHFAARLAAPPVEGAANAALVALVAGDTGRLKRLHVAGDVTSLAKIAASLYGDAP